MTPSLNLELSLFIPYADSLLVATAIKSALTNHKIQSIAIQLYGHELRSQWSVSYASVKKGLCLTVLVEELNPLAAVQDSMAVCQQQA
jgi:hypothetical protein